MEKEKRMVFEEGKSDNETKKGSPALGFLFVAILFFILGFLVGSMELFKYDKGGEVVEPVEEERVEQQEPEPEPEPKPLQEPAEEPEITQYSEEESGLIFIATLPPIADAYVDGDYIGKTNVSTLRGPIGKHEWKFVREEKSFVREITLKQGENPPLLLRFTE